jgi:ATP-dependent DNA helicase RecG
MPNLPPTALARPMTELRGIGPERASQLARLQLHTVEELLLHRPRRHEDRRHFQAIGSLRLGESVTTRGTIVALGLKRFRRGAKSVFEIVLEDGTGRLHCRWWNLPFLEKYFKNGDEVLVFGKVNELQPRTIDHPETEVVEAGDDASIHLGRIVPVYPLTEGLPQRWLRSLVWRTLAGFESLVAEPQPDVHLQDLPTRANAVHMLHFPEDARDPETARQRLAFDEFLELQLVIQSRRRKLLANARGRPCGGDNHLMRPFLAGLGFRLTDSQTRVLRELRHDLGSGRPMRRLLQGDVGSGKTVVAAACALMTLESGFNVALMAPTEILAEQHFQTFGHWFRPLGVEVELCTGSRKTISEAQPPTGNAERLSPLHASRFTHHSLAIGTHALIEETFTLANLGLVIIDEQHKFGVVQRETLVRKGVYPHLLVMTATPIPRTLGLTLYGDLDLSVIDELPGGRGRIRTFIRTADKLPQVWAFIREKLTEGRQAYVVYPRVEDDSTSELKAVTTEFGKLKRELAPHRVGLVHGRLSGKDKEAVMTAFRTNQTQVLLATSVIEVGLDVPNATLLLVENAERFGLSQLHQLRGRIGRGAHDSYCILVASARTAEAKERLQVLADTTDGFRIAEADLRLRGPGEFLGQAQSGLPPFRFGNLAEDCALIERARAHARMILNQRDSSSAESGKAPAPAGV